MNNSTITLDEKIACIRREIGMRQRVYPRWVEIGRLTQDKADDEIAVMQAVLEDLLARQPGEPEQGALL